VTWIDAILLAARGIARRPGRTALTVAAVALAAALLAALLTIVETGRDRVLEQLSKGGPLAGIIVEGSDLDGAALRRIEGLAGVRSAAPVAIAQELVVPPDPPVWGSGNPTQDVGGPSATVSSASPAEPGSPFIDGVVGVDLSRPDLFPLSLLAGRLPGATSMTEVAVTQGYLEHVGLDRSEAVRVLGTELELAASSSPEDPTSGASRWTKATVVGVVAQDAGPGDLVAPMGLVVKAEDFEGTGGSIVPLVPSRTRETLTYGPGMATGAVDSYTAIMVEATSLNEVTALRERIAALGYETSASETLIENVERYTHVIEIVLSAIGIIALLIAGIGIADALFAAVRERRREIGVLKAIGARDRDVRRLFLVEAGLTGFSGGMLGSTVGWAMARATGEVVNRYLTNQGLPPVAMGFPVAILTITILGSSLLALIAGVIPATRAAGLPAVEAMGEV
jgi:ABC-type antimicrobial peptide transport system permease subunit